MNVSIKINKKINLESLDKLYVIKWLSAKQRSIYNIITIVYKCIYLKSPKYLKDLVTYRIKSRTSRV